MISVVRDNTCRRSEEPAGAADGGMAQSDGTRPAQFAVAIIAAALLFAWFAETDTIRSDLFIRENIHRFASVPLTEAMRAFSLLGTAVVLTILTLTAVTLLYYLRRIRAALLFAIAMGGEVVIEFSLKHAFHRPRPIPFFGQAPHSYSFPSGHALASVCFYATAAAILAPLVRRSARWCIWIAALLLIVLTGFSRVYLGVHYPSDVIAGYCAGICWIGVLRLLSARAHHGIVEGRRGHQEPTKPP